MSKSIFFVSAAAFALAACNNAAPVDETSAEAVEPAAEMTPANWSYEGETGPEQWGEMNGDYALCGTGTVQSPVDLPASAGLSGDTPELVINYAAGPLVVSGQGYNSNINGTPDSHIMLDGERYDFLQVHMHTPSEYKLSGKQFPADAHLVHANADGELAVIGLFFEEGDANAAVGPAIDMFGTEKAEMAAEGVMFDPAAMLPADRGFFSFMGSLTTPPCSENVRWIVMDTPVEISAAQIAKMSDTFGNTARPLQSINDRPISYNGG